MNEAGEPGENRMMKVPGTDRMMNAGENRMTKIPGTDRTRSTRHGPDDGEPVRTGGATDTRHGSDGAGPTSAG
jgi:hypothetical protein